MFAENITVRRATVDDVPELKRLWALSQDHSMGMEKRVTEFQIACVGDGTLVGCLGLMIVKKDAWMHNDIIAHCDNPDAVRKALWERTLRVAQNNGLFRVWANVNPEFWVALAEFLKPDSEVLDRRPAEFGPGREEWLVRILREENASLISYEKELEVFQESIRAEGQASLRHAKMVGYFATFLALLFLVGACVFVFSVLDKTGTKLQNVRPDTRK